MDLINQIPNSQHLLLSGLIIPKIIHPPPQPGLFPEVFPAPGGWLDTLISHILWENFVLLTPGLTVPIFSLSGPAHREF